MVIRIFLTIIFIIIAIFNVKRSIIKEVDINPYFTRKKNNKLQNFLFSSIPYSLFKIMFVYVVLMVLSVLFLQSRCKTLNLIETYNYDTLKEDYKENNKKNSTYVYELNDMDYKIKNIDKVVIDKADSNYIEVYEIKSDNNFINILLYGTYERQIIIYKKIND